MGNESSAFSKKHSSAGGGGGGGGNSPKPVTAKTSADPDEDELGKLAVKDGQEVIGNYLVETILGRGSFAEVKLGRNIKTGEKVALKLIQKGELHKGKRRVHLQREIRFLKLLYHPNIGMLFEVIEQPDVFVLIMEHAGGGELLKYIREAENHRIPEVEARRLFRQIVSAMDYCHQNNLIHRDIKPENILLDDNRDVKLIDFGFSREFTPESQLDSFIGSPHYAAPQLLQGIKYNGPEVDIWSMGVLLYVMVCGRQPFKHPDMKELYNKIGKGVFEYPTFLSTSAKELISRMIVVDPTNRAKMEEVKNHPWLCEGYDGPPPNCLEGRTDITTIDPDVLKELLSYGFQEEEARTSLINNDGSIICNFYHLMLEKKSREQEEAPIVPEDTSEDDFIMVDSPVVSTAEGEQQRMDRIEARIRAQVMRRQSTQYDMQYFKKKADQAKQSKAKAAAK